MRINFVENKYWGKMRYNFNYRRYVSVVKKNFKFVDFLTLSFLFFSLFFSLFFFFHYPFLLFFPDINECSLGTDSCDKSISTCHDVGGTYFCVCKDGYTQGANNRICQRKLTSMTSR